MATLTEIHNIWKDGVAIQARFLAACLKLARIVIDEDPGTDNHADRLAWANQVAAGDEGVVIEKARQMTRYSLAMNTTLQASGNATSDSDIEWMVSTYLDAIVTGA
jgi:hypothetical protein